MAYRRLVALLFIAAVMLGLTTVAMPTTYFFTVTGASPTPTPSGATYYIAPAGGGGNDSNTGTSPGSPWLTPLHALNCGDQVLATAGTYDEANFRPGRWGVVTCPANNNVAWLKCSTFDTCKITISTAGHDAMTPTQSYWGIQGWEVHVSTPSTNQCFEAFPPNNSTTIHHVIFANNIANGCGDGAFTTGAAGSPPFHGVDYVAILGNIAYNAAQDNANCYSGIDIVAPVNSDTVAGTHIYIGGNYSWHNIDPNPCSGHTPTDGQGISLDTINDAPNGYAYSGQIVIDNNISVFNGGTGIQSFQNTGGSPNAPIYIRNNTTYGNQTGSINANPCAETNLASSLSTQVFGNLVQAATATACLGGVNLFALGVSAPDGTDQLFNNFIFSAAGNNTTGSGSGFAYGSNTTSPNPSFANPVQPSAPSCGAFASVPACMATVIANFTPANATAKGFGRQAPGPPVVDALFPQWLCHVTNLPAGLITMGCGTPTPTPTPTPSPTPTFTPPPGCPAFTPIAEPTPPPLVNPQNPVSPPYNADPTGAVDAGGAFHAAALVGDLNVPNGTFKINSAAGITLPAGRNVICQPGTAIIQTNISQQTVFQVSGAGSVFNCHFRGPYYNVTAGFNTFYEDFLHVNSNSSNYRIVGNDFNGSAGYTGAVDWFGGSGDSGGIIGWNTFSHCAYYATQLIQAKNVLFENNQLNDCAAFVEANVGLVNTGNKGTNNVATFTLGTGNSRVNHSDGFGSEFTCGVDANGAGFDYSGNTCQYNCVNGSFGSRFEKVPDCISGSCPPNFAAAYPSPNACIGGCTFH